MDKKGMERKEKQDKWATWQRQVLDYVPAKAEKPTQESKPEQTLTRDEIEKMIHQEAMRIANSRTEAKTPVCHHGQYDQVISRIKNASRQTGNWQTF